MSLLNELDHSILANTFEILSTNLQVDASGQTFGETEHYESFEDNTCAFKIHLIAFQLMGKMHGLSIDFDRLYDELYPMLQPGSWSQFGYHRLVLQVKDAGPATLH